MKLESTNNFSVTLQNIKFNECISSGSRALTNISQTVKLLVVHSLPDVSHSQDPLGNPTRAEYKVTCITEAPASVSFTASLYQLPICVTSPERDTQRRCTLHIPSKRHIHPTPHVGWHNYIKCAHETSDCGPVVILYTVIFTFGYSIPLRISNRKNIQSSATRIIIL
jgi:hypothetical protein